MAYKKTEDKKRSSRKYYLENKEKCNLKSKAYYSTHKERMNELIKKANMLHKECYTERALRHRKMKEDWFWNRVGRFCRHCNYKGSTAALQFHHLKPTQKENVKDNFSKWVRKHSFDYLKQKVSEHEFIILCANCHSELHAGLWELDVEGNSDNVFCI